jgi:hypothetical protein
MAAIAAREGSTAGGTALLRPARAIMRRQVGYHAGRVAIHIILGTTFGFGGAAALKAFASVGIYRVLYVPNALATSPFCLMP